MTAVIIDDEEHCRSALSGLLQRKFKEIDLVGMATSVPEGIELVKHEEPELLFLDIEIGDQLGFDLLTGIAPYRPHVIFTTAHESYALKAIRFSALDYLLKPVNEEDLRAALAKCVETKRTDPSESRIAALLKNISMPGAERKLALPVAEGLEVIAVDDILSCESDSNYTVVHLKDKKRLVISRTLKEFEDMLSGSNFVRIHHSHLINVKYVKKYIRGEGGEVIMTDGSNIAVSRRKKQELMDSLSRL